MKETVEHFRHRSDVAFLSGSFLFETAAFTHSQPAVA